MLDSKKVKKQKNINLEYKNRYLKYKNKYFELKGGLSSTINYTIITILLIVLSMGSYILYTQLSTPSNKSNITSNLLKETEFIKDLESITTGTFEGNIFLEKYYKYSNINLIEKIKNIKKDDKIMNMDSLITNYILINNLYSPFKLKNVNSLVNEEGEYSDTFILCLQNKYNRSYNTIKTDLIDEIKNESIYDKYFENDTKTNKDKDLQDRYDSNRFRLNYSNINNDVKSNTKIDYIQYIRNSNNNPVSDIPMVEAAARKYNKYIILNIKLSNANYIKVFKPKNKIILNQKNFKDNVLLLEYINICDYECDFVKDFNKLKKEDYILNNKNKKYAKTDKLYNIDNYDHINIEEFFNNIKNKNDKNNIDENTQNDKKNKNITTVDIYKKDYFYDEKEKHNDLLYSFNLINEEKKNITKKLNKRPYYQYYEFYKPEEIKKINIYINYLNNK